MVPMFGKRRRRRRSSRRARQRDGRPRHVERAEITPPCRIWRTGLPTVRAACRTAARRLGVERVELEAEHAVERDHCSKVRPICASRVSASRLLAMSIVPTSSLPLRESCRPSIRVRGRSINVPVAETPHPDLSAKAAGNAGQADACSQPSVSSPVGIGTFSGESFRPAASATVSSSAAKSFSR